mgnify:FL=1
MNTQFNANVYHFTQEIFKNLIAEFDGKVVGGEDMKINDVMEHFFAGYVPNPEDMVVVDEGEEVVKKKKSKKKKVPGQPKRATTAFFFYTASIREEVKQKNPGKKVGELSKIHAAMWNALSDEEKAPFAQQTQEDKERYKKEMEAWKKE